MSTDPTQPQAAPQRRRAREMSLQRGHPPAQLAGYDADRLLGVGAYGEVWVARERNTGRQVAIKFYAHRGGLDWSLLSREVEKLAFLFADRYVVQLLAVGWDSEPPYYVMEYLERGSLADRIAQGPLPVDEAVALFRDVAVGLVHAHNKGVLHCDLKPANVLLDDDGRPRLADFGQSRLSHEQAPALGTLFYMAPEQADLEAVPDARWDVYALGALLYCMLTGDPPHRSDQAADRIEKTPHLAARLKHYRKLIEESPPAQGHRRVRGVDRALAEIVDRCLAADPERRFPTVQAVLDALDARDEARSRRPLVLLGTIAPALVLLVVFWFAWRGFSAAVQQSDRALVASALASNGLAAELGSRTAAFELERRWSAVRHLAVQPGLRRTTVETLAHPEIAEMLEALADPNLGEAEAGPLRQRFREHPARLALERAFLAAIPTGMAPGDHDGSQVASWFYCDPGGVSTVRVPTPEPPRTTTVGNNYAWRSYFNGAPDDLRDRTWRPPPGEHLEETTLSAVFRSQANNQWIVAISTPVFSPSPDGEFLGVVALTVKVGELLELPGLENQFAVLVDRREGQNHGVILDHPLFDRLLDEQGKLPDRFKDYKLTEMDLPTRAGQQEDYRDPLAADPEGGEYQGRWLAKLQPVVLHGQNTGWVVIVQQAYETAIGSTLDRLRLSLVGYGAAALLMIGLVMAAVWKFAGTLKGR